MPSNEPDLFAIPAKSTNTPGISTFNLEITYGAGDPASAWGKDLAVANTSTGKITVAFPRTYRKLTGFRWGWKKCAAGAVYFPVILTNSIDTPDSSGRGFLVIETRTGAGTATDPASGDVLSLEFEVTLDSLNDGYAITIT